MLQHPQSVPEPRRVSGACPSFFIGCVLESRKSSYEIAGYHLAMHLDGLVWGDVDDDVLDDLHALARTNDAAGIVEWIGRVLPRCMRLVPSRRRYSTFMKGVQAALDDGRL